MRVPPDTVSLADYERHFHARIEPGIRAYIAGAAADGITQQANRDAFDRLRLLPRALADLRGATAHTTLLGQSLDYPLLIGPTAFHKLVDADGELATAQAAALTRTGMVVSAQASVPLEAIAASSPSPLWLQLYLQPARDDTLTLVRRAENAGYQALMVTIDAVVSGVRNIEQRAGFRLPDGVAAVNLQGFRPNAPVVARAGSPVFQGMLANAPTWDDIAWLCRQTTLPVLVKGLLNPADVPRALDAGVAGIVVSNHGGRTLDTVPATIDVLQTIANAVAGRVPLLLDGGIRRGTDIVKALALGANAVMIGQPVLHALAVGGLAGVAHMLTILQTELEIAMALTGAPTVEAIDASLLWNPGGPGTGL
ncbi:alpha-hydroxy acid oxidase [Cupriavidus sp. AU9028]|uniref:alpha-hydroxy acid oxidase n=1 Tax=Cupriavidus sp. AU9028 TaxID=2871157 RepID=UPI001C98D54D|nr:alpha-hydroxy acid oxidase [Cupriavidus sp. AU9028]MBY4896098.1 alpha-hydroxy-acid oxidizing protein [Cupriavidus sp. AU9028]